jgi:hypothetical protein
MCTTADCHTTQRPVDNFFAALDEFPHVAEARCTICVSEQRILSSDMSQSMGDTTSFASVLLQVHHAKHIMQVVVFREFENHIDRPVPATIVDDQDLIAVGSLPQRIAAAARPRMSVRARPRSGLTTVRTTDVLVQPGNRLLQCGQHAVFFVVGWENDTEVHLGRFDCTCVGRGKRFVGPD